MNIQLFVSTQETQGQRENDFCFVPEGEIVTFGVFACDNEQVDGPCGCARSLCGVKTGTATTSMQVVAFPGSMHDVAALIQRSLVDGGWTPHATHAGETAMKLASRAASFPVGTIVEYRDGTFVEREKRTNHGAM